MLTAGEHERPYMQWMRAKYGGVVDSETFRIAGCEMDGTAHVKVDGQ
jgi:hypothetical protein